MFRTCIPSFSCMICPSTARTLCARSTSASACWAKAGVMYKVPTRMSRQSVVQLFIRMAIICLYQVNLLSLPLRLSKYRLIHYRDGDRIRGVTVHSAIIDDQLDHVYTQSIWSKGRCHSRCILKNRFAARWSGDECPTKGCERVTIWIRAGTSVERNRKIRFFKRYFLGPIRARIRHWREVVAGDDDRIWAAAYAAVVHNQLDDVIPITINDKSRRNTRGIQEDRLAATRSRE